MQIQSKIGRASIYQSRFNDEYSFMKHATDASRRIANRSAIMIGLIICLFATACSANAERVPPTVEEVTLAAPDILRVEIREAPIEKGEIISLSSPAAQDRGEWIKHATGEYGIIIGPNKDHLRIADKLVGAPLNRAKIDQAHKYDGLAGLNIINVHRKSVPYSSGTTRDDSARHEAVAFRHFVYLKLSGNIAPGTHTISWPDNALPDTVFTYDPAKTRLSSLRTSQLGHKSSDVGKYAYLALWLPNGANDGAVDFRNYGIDKFEIIDAFNNTVYNGKITLRKGPRDAEPNDGLAGTLVKYLRENNTSYSSNRSGTYVFGLDYSNWKNARRGSYRIRIPGVGISDAITIGEDVWLKAATASVGGLYNQRSGTALDGRYGYTRPECYGPNSEVPVFQSKMPLHFTTEGIGHLPFTDAAKPNWITSTQLSDVSGGHMDAGDWDRRVQHVEGAYLLLDVYPLVDRPQRRMTFRSRSNFINRAAALLTGGEYPDVLSEAIWTIDFFRKLQREDGAVSGGIDSQEAPVDLQPCWLESRPAFAYAPDSISTYAYAAAAGKLYLALLEDRREAQANLYLESALKAWDWAESNGQQAFTDAAALLEGGVNRNHSLLSRLEHEAGNNRFWAAGVLYRATGEDKFNKIILDRFAAGHVSIGAAIGNGAWEYLNSTHNNADPRIQEIIRKNTINVANDALVEVQSGYSYQNFKHAHKPMGWGAGVAPDTNEASLLIRAHHITQANLYLEVMQNASAHMLGANQVGMSFTTGLGVRSPNSVLHLNSHAAGIAAPPGITIYGWAPYQTTDYWWVWGPNWAALSDLLPEKKVEPYRKSLPTYEYIIEHPGIIQQTEFTVQQTMFTTAAIWLYLNSH